MNEATARMILVGFEAVRPAPTETTDRRWRWAEGVHLFPEAVCPFCKVVMRSPCIWLVNEGARRLDGIVGLRGGRLVAMQRRHPHVRSDGTICMNGGTSIGPASSAAEALFLAIYPGSSMLGAGRTRSRYWDEWLAEYFDHTEHDEAGLRRRARPKLFKAVRKRKTA